MMDFIRKCFNFRHPWKTWIAILVAISAGIFLELGGNLFWINCKLAIPYLFIFALLFIMLYNLRSAFLNAYALYRHEAEPHKAMIILVSALNIMPEKKNNNFPWTISSKGAEATINGASLENDINLLEKEKPKGLRWNWQQLMRSLLPHQQTLQIIYLLGSPDIIGKIKTIEGSHKHLNLAEELIKQYLKGDIKIKQYPAVSFEDFDNLIISINRCIEEIKSKDKIKEKDILIEITGGQKTASIAGAMATLNTRVTFQYVDTNPDPDTGEYKIWAYDVAIESPISI